MQKRKMNRTRDALPLMLAAGLLPLCTYLTSVNVDFMTYPWFPNRSDWPDLFLYGKSRLLMGLGLVMALLLFWQWIHKRLEKPGKEFLPWAVLAVLWILSALKSEYPWYSLSGMIEQYEPVGVLLSYLILGFYAYEYTVCGGRMKPVLTVLGAGAAVLCLAGAVQLLQYVQDPENWKGIYLTLYNPNYAGIYLVMGLPLLWICGGKKGRIPAAAGTVLLLATGSGTAMAAGGILLLLGLYLLCRPESEKNESRKRKLLAVPAALLAAGICIWNLSGLNGELPEEIPLEQVETHADSVSLVYRGIPLTFRYEIYDTGNPKQIVRYEDGTPVPLSWSEERGECDPEDEALEGLHFKVYKKDAFCYIQFRCQDVIFRFTDSLGTGSYEYVSVYGKTDKLTDAEAAFQGGQRFLTGRGYIWSRTLPLIKNHVLLGTGPDTFMLVFPQNDYAAKARLGGDFYRNILTNAHSLYLQMAVQNGVPALLCLLLIAGSYLKKSWRLYGKVEMSDEKKYFGAALMLGVTGYLLCGITWASSVCTTPLFWLFLGLGYGELRKLKPQE